MNLEALYKLLQSKMTRLWIAFALGCGALAFLKWQVGLAVFAAVIIIAAVGALGAESDLDWWE